MKKKSLLMITILIVLTMLVGCGTKVPFETNPDGNFKIESIEKEISKMDETKKDLDQYYTFRTLGTMPKELGEKVDKMSDEQLREFTRRGQIISFLRLAFKGDEKQIEVELVDDIQNYIKTSKLGAKDLEFFLSDEMKKNDPVGAVQEYMTKNNIKITNISFPNNLEEINAWTYPMKAKYKYVVNGTVDGKEFEKEVVQTFYIGFDMEDGKVETIQEKINYIE